MVIAPEKINDLLADLDQRQQELTAARAVLIALRDGGKVPEATQTPDFIRHTAPSAEAYLKASDARAANDWRHLSVAKASYLLLKEEGPQDTAVIADALLAHGITSKARNFHGSVYTTLRESSLFVRLKDQQKWDLAANHPAVAKKKAKGAKASK